MRQLTFGDRSKLLLCLAKDTSQAIDALGKFLSFLDRVSLWTYLKRYEVNIKALALASRLEGPAFENYGRMTDKEETTYSASKASLKRKFLSGGDNQMQAVRELRQRKWTEGEELIEAFVHEIAIDWLTWLTRTLARDAFLESLRFN